MTKPKWIFPRIHNLPQVFIFVDGTVNILLIKIIGIVELDRIENFNGIMRGG